MIPTCMKIQVVAAGLDETLSAMSGRQGTGKTKLAWLWPGIGEQSLLVCKETRTGFTRSFTSSETYLHN